MNTIYVERINRAAAKSHRRLSPMTSRSGLCPGLAASVSSRSRSLSTLSLQRRSSWSPGASAAQLQAGGRVSPAGRLNTSTQVSGTARPGSSGARSPPYGGPCAGAHRERSWAPERAAAVQNSCQTREWPASRRRRGRRRRQARSVSGGTAGAQSETGDPSTADSRSRRRAHADGWEPGASDNICKQTVLVE